MSDSINITIISSAIRSAIKPLTRDFGELIYLQSSHNGTANFANRACVKTEQIIISELQNAKGNYPIMNVNSPDVVGDSDFRWLIDPMDGLLNFSHAIPFFCVTIALQKRIGDKFETVAAIIEAPAFEESYIAEKSNGAWIDNYSRFSKGKLKMRVSNRVNSAETIILKDSRYGSETLEMIFVGTGKIDACILEEVNKNRASIARLFIEESGGFFNLENKKLIACNSPLQKEFLK